MRAVDIWVECSTENSKRIYDSLIAFGAPVSSLTLQTFMEPGIVFQIGVSSKRIDFLTSIDGVDFIEAYKDKEQVELEGLMIPFLSKQHLIQNKEAAGREKDKLDARQLKVRLGQ